MVVAVVMMAVCFSALPAAASTGAPVPSAETPTLHIQIIAEQVGSKYQFAPAVIIIPQVPIVMNITFTNNQTVADGVQHTFTIDNNKGAHGIDTGLVNPQVNVTVVFRINAMNNITYNGTSFTPGPAPQGTDNGTIQFYCIPHVSLGMKGVIMLGSAVPVAAQPEKGVFLRAYWIGIIGIGAMIVWVGISYFLIKWSSPRFKDHKEHVRKGLP